MFSTVHSRATKTYVVSRRVRLSSRLPICRRTNCRSSVHFRNAYSDINFLTRLMTFLRAQATGGKKSLGSDFKTGLDRMNIISFVQSLSL